MTGARIDATHAREIGLVNHVVADDQLLAKARAMAERLAPGAPMAVSATKAALNKIARRSKP